MNRTVQIVPIFCHSYTVTCATSDALLTQQLRRVELSWSCRSYQRPCYKHRQLKSLSTNTHTDIFWPRLMGWYRSTRSWQTGEWLACILPLPLCHSLVLPHGLLALSTLPHTAGIQPINRKKTSCLACRSLTMHDGGMGGLDPKTLQHIWLTGTTIVLFSRELKPKKSGVGVEEDTSSLGEWSVELNLTVLCVIMKKMWPATNANTLSASGIAFIATQFVKDYIRNTNIIVHSFDYLHPGVQTARCWRSLLC